VLFALLPVAWWIWGMMDAKKLCEAFQPTRRREPSHRWRRMKVSSLRGTLLVLAWAGTTLPAATFAVDCATGSNGLSLCVTAAPDPVRSGELLRYEFTVSNVGSGPLNNVTLRDETSTSTSFVVIRRGDCPFSTCDPGEQVTWALGDLPPGESVTRQLILRAGSGVTTGTLLFNTARVMASNAPEVHVDRSVRVDADASADGRHCGRNGAGGAGRQLTYLVTFANRGTTAVSGVTLHAMIPAGTEFLSATPGFYHAGRHGELGLGTVGAGKSGSGVSRST